MLCRARVTWRSTSKTSVACFNNPQWRLQLRRAYANSHGQHAASATRDNTVHVHIPHNNDVVPIYTFGTITTTAPHRTPIDRLLDELANHTEAAPRPSTPDKTAFLSLFLTPSYAQHALDTSLPLRALERLKGGAKLDKPLNTLTAVVDRLPVPESSGAEDGVGREGLAYTFLRDAGLVVSGIPVLQDPSAPKPGSLSFTISPIRHEKLLTRTLQLPLAQTIFSTGRASTLIETSYRPVAAESGTLQAQPQRFLESQTFRIPFAARVKTTPHVYVPLVPLTPARRVRHCMGNIIRALARTDRPFARTDPQDREDEPSQPASQELESAVSAYFAACAIPPEPVAVWALVVPNLGAQRLFRKGRSARVLLQMGGEDVGNIWTATPGPGRGKGDPRTVNLAISRLLTAGARLHRVLSGGGGWGKKAGLLSLDPDTSYSTRDLRGDAGWEVDFGEPREEEQKQRALGEIVKEGEVVMFFIAPRNLTTSSTADAGGSDMEHLAPASHAAVFGAIPSTMDDLPLANVDAETRSSDVDFKHYPSFFGVLSEGGMAVTMEDGDPKVVVQTKVDVPFSRFSVTHATQSTSEVDRAEGYVEGVEARDGVYASFGRVVEAKTAEENAKTKTETLGDVLGNRRRGNGEAVGMEEYFESASELDDPVDDGGVETGRARGTARVPVDKHRKAGRREFSSWAFVAGSTSTRSGRDDNPAVDSAVGVGDGAGE